MGLSIWQILLVLAVILLLFGAKRLPGMMGDIGKGIRNFKEGLNGNQDTKKIDHKDDD